MLGRGRDLLMGERLSSLASLTLHSVLFREFPMLTNLNSKSGTAEVTSPFWISSHVWRSGLVAKIRPSFRASSRRAFRDQAEKKFDGRGCKTYEGRKIGRGRGGAEH